MGGSFVNRGIQSFPPRYFSPTSHPFFSLSSSNLYSSTPIRTATFLHLLPPSPSLHQIKQAHARLVAIGLGGDAAASGRLLAAVSLLKSPPPDYSRAIFNCIPDPNIFARNNIIRCYAKSATPQESLVLYADMRSQGVRPNNYTFPFVLQACSKTLEMTGGAQVHGHVVKMGFAEDLYIRNALIYFYSSFHQMGDSRRVFDECPRQCDVVSWNAILAGYAKDGQIDLCEKLFDEMPVKDVISWSSLAMGYVQGGMPEKGIELFKNMKEKGVMPNEAMLTTVLSASAQLGLLLHGQMVHNTIKELDIPQSIAIGTALVDMYAKCGCIDTSRKVFDEMRHKDVFAWNAMICGLATHGLASEALSLFQNFLSNGRKPVNVTFIGVLLACSRAGWIEEGRFYFKLMREKYNIEPEMEHYGCMVDLLSRAGLVREALELIEKMTAPPDPVLWGTLLGACKTHGLVELGESIGKKLIEMEPSHEGHYVLLANIYARKNKWVDVMKVRRLMVARGATKVAGWSLIEAQGRVHQFVAGDREHERSKEIYDMLEDIGKRLEKAGYLPDVSPVLHDIGDEEKGHVIREHSERLAIAFGLLVTDVGESIRVVKNLRVCSDCHEVSKMISSVFEREIVVRDGSRFHHFKRGRCSCLDYW